MIWVRTWGVRVTVTARYEDCSIPVRPFHSVFTYTLRVRVRVHMTCIAASRTAILQSFCLRVVPKAAKLPKVNSWCQ